MAKAPVKSTLAASNDLMAKVQARRARLAERAAAASKVGAKKAPVKAENELPGDLPVAAPVGDIDLGNEKMEIGIVVPQELETAMKKADEELAAVDEASPAAPGIILPESIMAVADLDSFSADQEVAIDMIPFAETETVQAHWVLFANGEPLAKIALKDQDNAGVIAAHFMTNDYARAVIAGISERGLVEVLNTVKAKTYAAKVDDAKTTKQIKAKLEAESAAALKSKVAAIKARFTENLGLVLQAAASNFLVENALKDAFVQGMVANGMVEASAAQLADDCFFRFGPKTIAAFLDKAEEWSAYSAESMKEIKASMQSAGVRSRPLPSQIGASAVNPSFNAQLAAQYAAAAVPVQHTAPAFAESVSANTRFAPAPAEDAATVLRRKIGGFGSSGF